MYSSLFKSLNNFILVLITATLLVACGGGTDSTPIPAPVTAASPTLTFAAVKTFRFNWTDVNDATYYKLLENPDGISGFTQVGNNIAQGVQSVDHVVPLYARINAQYILQSCNVTGCTDSSTVTVSGNLEANIGYVKASNTGVNDYFGAGVSLSGDGNTLAVGAMESSNTTEINGDQTNDSATFSGAVYVYSRSGSTWAQQAYIKAINTEANDKFGSAISLSHDGNTLAVGASLESSNAIGINSDHSNNLMKESGAVYVFVRNNTSWAQQAYVKASNTGSLDYFGIDVSLSADGNKLVVGAHGEDSNAISIDGDQTDNSGLDSGAVYVFGRIDSTWTQQSYIKASNSEASDNFGYAVSLSDDGNTLAVGAHAEDSNATGVNADQTNNSLASPGAVYVFSYNGIAWSQQAYIKASNTGSGDAFGVDVSLNDDGNTLAVGAWFEASIASGINGNQDDNQSFESGAVYVFSRSGSTWAQQAYIKASTARSGIRFGRIVSLSNDGNTLVAGAYLERSSATGINGNQIDTSASGAGAAYAFSRSGGIWSQQAYIKASNTEATDRFGSNLCISGDGNTLAVAAVWESSLATGIAGDQSDNLGVDAGAVYLY